MSDFLSQPPRGSQSGATASGGPRWEQSVLEKMALELVAERRTARRWNIFFRLVFLAYLTALAAYLLGWFPSDEPAAGGPGRHTALVSIEGEISADGKNSAEVINRSLRAAFKDAGTAGVVLRVNSPGGSPVQSGLIYREIRRLRKEYPDTRLVAVVEEICASGGYYVAAAADEIHVDKASLVGSIGVLLNGFGFTGTMQKLGVERRLYTAGENKGFLDPFTPVAPAERDHIQQMLGDIHTQFIEAVRAGRGDKLNKSADLFTGLVWTGERSVELGLADGLGSVDSVARDLFEAEKIVNFRERKSIVDRLADKVGVQLMHLMSDGLGAASTAPVWR